MVPKAKAQSEEVSEDEVRRHRELGLDDASLAGLVRRDGGKLFTDAQLRDIVSFDDYLANYASELVKAEDFVGSGAQPLVGDAWMDHLIGEPCILLQWNFTASDIHDSWFVYVEVLTQSSRRYSFTSGSQFGIRDQLYELSSKTGTFNHVVCRGGLIDRPWPWTDPDTNKTRIIHVPALPSGAVHQDQA